MKLDKMTNCVNFKATVQDGFINNAKRYYSKREMSFQYDKFVKQLEKLEYMGEHDSEIVYSNINTPEGCKHVLCLKNKSINPKEAIIIAISKKYIEVLHAFMRLNDDIVQDFEMLLHKKH